jgi:hypothetical protein
MSSRYTLLTYACVIKLSFCDLVINLCTNKILKLTGIISLHAVTYSTAPYTLSVKLSDSTCDVIPDGKTEQFWQAIALASELPFPVVFHTEDCAVHSGNPTFSSVYLPTPRWHHLKSHPFLAIHSADEHRMIYSFSKYYFLLHILRFLFFFSDNIMADVTSKQQMTAFYPP